MPDCCLAVALLLTVTTVISLSNRISESRGYIDPARRDLLTVASHDTLTLCIRPHSRLSSLF